MRSSWPPRIIAALWPERSKGIVSVSGYLIGSPAANQAPLLPKATLAFWYQYYFATDIGRAGYEKYLHAFAKLIWQTARIVALERKLVVPSALPSRISGHGVVAIRCRKDDPILDEEGDGVSKNGLPGNFLGSSKIYSPAFAMDRSD